MPYQYKREPLNDDEVNSIANACDTFREKSVVWTLLDTGLRLSEFADLKKRKYPVAGKKIHLTQMILCKVDPKCLYHFSVKDIESFFLLFFLTFFSSTLR